MNRITKGIATSIANGKVMNDYSFSMVSKEVADNFKYLSGNRGMEVFEPKSQKKIQELVEYVCSGEPIGAILVNRETNTIMDGNHRLYAFRKIWEQCPTIKIPVQYCSTHKELENTRTINSKADNWQSWEYLMSDAINGDEQAKRIVRFCEENPICLAKNHKPSTRIAYALLTGKDGSHSVNKGEYNITDEQYETAKTIIMEINRILSVKKIDKTNEKFILAYCQLRRNNELKPILDNWDLFCTCKKNGLKSFKYQDVANKETQLNSLRAIVSKFQANELNK